MLTRDAVIRKARECIGTPFRDQGRVKGLGLDCLGIILWTCAELGIRDAAGAPIGVEQYGEWGGSPVGEFMLRECERRLYEKPIDLLEPADVLVMAVSHDPTHLAIVTTLQGSPAILHAYGGAIRKVSEHILDLKWKRRIRGVFTLPGVEG